MTIIEVERDVYWIAFVFYILDRPRGRDSTSPFYETLVISIIAIVLQQLDAAAREPEGKDQVFAPFKVPRHTTAIFLRCHRHHSQQHHQQQEQSSRWFPLFSHNVCIWRLKCFVISCSGIRSPMPCSPGWSGCCRRQDRQTSGSIHEYAHTLRCPYYRF